LDTFVSNTTHRVGNRHFSAAIRRRFHLAQTTTGCRYCRLELFWSTTDNDHDDQFTRAKYSIPATGYQTRPLLPATTLRGFCAINSTLPKCFALKARWKHGRQASFGAPGEIALHPMNIPRDGPGPPRLRFSPADATTRRPR
jgi:hypothetical protein